MRLDRFIQQKSHDPYDLGRKYTEGMYCPRCGARYHQGRWRWSEKDNTSGEPQLCPACRRILDNFPAGEIRISGKYVNNHRNEIVNLIQNVIREEEARSPLKKVIDFTLEGDRLTVSLTDDHLARHIGEAVHRAYDGDLAIKYSEGEKFVRLHWHRDV